MSTTNLDQGSEIPQDTIKFHLETQLLIRCFNEFYLMLENDRYHDEVQFAVFEIDAALSYVGFCDDFGPTSLGSIHQFCEIVTHQLIRNPGCKTAMLVPAERRELTNAVFLVGSYMIMKLDIHPDVVDTNFQPISSRLLAYRDVSPGEPNFPLHLKDCWAGLWRAKSLGWANFGPGGFDPAEYAHLDSPLNADLHEVVPGKLLAMRGPRDLPHGAMWRDTYDADGAFSHRDFSPAHYANILSQLGVAAVVRLNEPEYDAGAFRAAGIAVADLFFEDCSPPPVDVVAKFLLLAERVPGPVAVHCKAGLGRTGTLIALYMMRAYAFTAREAMGWLRIVRPGSVIGEQQHFLCAREPLMRREAERHRQSQAGDADIATVAAAAEAATELHSGAGLAAAEQIIGKVFADLDKRVALAAAAAAGRKAGPLFERAPGDAATAAHVAAAAERRNGRRAMAGTGATAITGSPLAAAAT